MKHKASPPAQPMLPRDVPDGPWQEIMADYFTHKGKEHLLICNLFSNYPFLYKVFTKSAQTLCACLLELISQYGPLSLLFMDNGQPFASEELTQFLQCHHIEHPTSSPHFPRSKGFIECQIQTLKTALSTSHDSHKPLEDVLLHLWSTPIGPYMSYPHEILHNRTFQHPSKPVDMESVRNYLISHRQSQKTYFDKAHGTHDLIELGPRQEVLFRSPVEDEYIPRTIVKWAAVPCSYIMEAQGKRYCRTREHLWPIHHNLPNPAQPQPLPPKPKLPVTCILKPNPKHKHLLHPIPLPGPSAKPLCCIPHPSKPYTTQAPKTNAAPSVKDLLWHLYTTNPLPQC